MARAELYIPAKYTLWTVGSEVRTTEIPVLFNLHTLSLLSR